MLLLLQGDLFLNFQIEPLDFHRGPRVRDSTLAFDTSGECEMKNQESEIQKTLKDRLRDTSENSDLRLFLPRTSDQ